MTAKDCNLRRFHCTGHAAQPSSGAEHHRIFPRFAGWLAMYIALGCTAIASRLINCADSAYSAALVRAWRDWRGTFELSRESDGRHAVVQVAPGLIRAGRGKLREAGVGIPVGLRGDAPGWEIVANMIFEFSREARKP